MNLRSQQRVPLPPADNMVFCGKVCSQLTRCPPKENCRYWISWWRMSISFDRSPHTPGFVTGITSASLVALGPPEVDLAMPVHYYWTFLMAQCLKQLARVNIHQLIIGRLETTTRPLVCSEPHAEECSRGYTRNNYSASDGGYPDNVENGGAALLALSL